VDEEIELQDLCAAMDVTPRTVHFYVQQGLLPGPDGAGRGAKYSKRHLIRLRLVRRLQKEHLPLAEIRRRLDALSDKEVEALLETTASDKVARESALDYVRSVLSAERSPRSRTPQSPALVDMSTQDAPARSTWDRVALTTDIELHIRRPLSRHGNRQVEKLLAAARQVLKEQN